jgi:hypothetical protein
MRVTAPIRASAKNAVNHRKNCANFSQITTNLVFARTSAPDSPPQDPTLSSVSRPNAPASPPLADTRLPRAQSKGCTPAAPRRSQVTSHRTPVTPRLIYGTGIKKLWKPTPIDEYKVLIYGKPRPQRFRSSTAGIPKRTAAIASNAIDLAACLPYACSLKALQIIAFKPRAPHTGRRKENHPAWRT